MNHRVISPLDRSCGAEWSVPYIQHPRELSIQEAIVYFEEKLVESPENFRYHQNIAPLFVSQGKLRRAAHHYRQAITLNPGDNKSRNDLAVLLYRLGKWEGALAALLYVLRERPDFTAAHSNVSVVYFSKGEDDLALYHARRAVHLDPTNPRLLRNLAQCLDVKGNSKEAKSVYKVALGRGPGIRLEREENDVKAYKKLGALMMMMGGPDKQDGFNCIDAYRALTGKTLELEHSEKTYQLLAQAGIK